MVLWSTQLIQCGGKLLDIDPPVTATFDHPAQRHDRGKYRMAVPAPCKMSDFWPGIRVEQVVAGRINAGGQQQTPEIDQIGPYKAQIFRLWAVPGLAIGITCKAVLRLVNTDDKMVWILGCQVQRGQADAAAGIQDQWW